MNNIKNKISAYVMSVCLLVPATASLGQEVAFAESQISDKDERIDLGYISLPKRAVTGAVSRVFGTELEKTPDANLPRTFVGRLSGLTTQERDTELSRGAYTTEYPGMSWWIRGLSSINGTTPMVILDGVLCPNTNYVYITPEEIESVTVLKDAAVLSLYGIQGANGVISIKTKRGSIGRANVTVTYDQSFQQMTRTPRFVNSGEYVNLRNQAGYNDGLGRYSQFSQWDTEQFQAGDSELYPNNNWYDMFVRPLTLMSRAGVTVRGGNEKVQYFSNINYLHQQSPFKTVEEPDRKYNPEPKNDWFNFRSNVDVKFNSYLSGFLRLAGNIKNEKTAGFGNLEIYSHLFALPPTMYGPLTPSGEGYENGGQVVTHEDETYPVYGMLNRSGYVKSLSINITAQSGLNVDLSFLTKGLSIGGVMAYQTSTCNQTFTKQDFERYIRTKDMNGLYFTQQGSAANTPLVYSKASAMDYNLNLYANANYSRVFGDHSIDAMGYIFYLNQELQKSNMLYKRESLGLTATYGYKNRYFIKADVGYSGSEQFHPDKRYIATPAISGAWIVSDEAFMNGADWLSNLKLRASYGITANDQFGGERFLYLDYIDVNGNEGLKGNPNLTAEKMKKQNYGFDLGLFNELTVSFDWYKSLCDNMLINSAGTIPEYQGVSLGNYPRTNWGKMENHGFEVEAMYAKRLNDDWSFYAGGSFSFNKNKVISVNESPYSADYAYRYRTEGQTLGQIWGYLIDYSNGNGMFNFKEELEARGLTYAFGSPRVGDFIYQDLNGDNVIDEKDKAPIGYSNLPRQSYNFSAGFKYKGLEFSVLFQGVNKVSRLMSGTGVYENIYQGVFNDIHQHAWTQERWNNGEKIEYPALSLNSSTNHHPNSFFVWDGSYLRLKNMEIAYTLPQHISKKINAENIRFSLSGQNLLTFDKMRSKYIDPEVSGMSSFQPYRVYNIGVSLTF
ncbi:SusC/RagA family TonB-linked outer membrane protein [Bacteroides acidifaciens]|uniref:SusC/RagA family TonB-linked outer membrane protein n=1 Tax=Bacteroides acidifaciens TaxID=85831 RepID=UPI00158D75C3|nr:SusC/RagA family TonB-linked outer membrane protein [Bacteroides acidifaciens]